ncbi:hypothetical protein B0J12DRAFT_340734 [Macrophomina phaseolina]|uniref:Uncharacterized protein n=1 Tax=Macrophomina phaseolina TaxID=35725 RepID=A0ABQ8GM07_9PEZI|nr:hypothetical protein B0J12DRAFT_340734 [Macrophomina phaseolina]
MYVCTCPKFPLFSKLSLLPRSPLPPPPQCSLPIYGPLSNSCLSPLTPVLISFFFLAAPAHGTNAHDSGWSPLPQSMGSMPSCRNSRCPCAFVPISVASCARSKLSSGETSLMKLMVWGAGGSWGWGAARARVVGRKTRRATRFVMWVVFVGVVVGREGNSWSRGPPRLWVVESGDESAFFFSLSRVEKGLLISPPPCVEDGPRGAVVVPLPNDRSSSGSRHAAVT